MSGAGGALSADLYNRQLHTDEKAAIHAKANGDTAEEKKLTQAACYAVKCWAEFVKFQGKLRQWTRGTTSWSIITPAKFSK